MALRWGYMGTGRIAEIVAKDFALSGLKIQAVGSRNLSSAQEFASRHNIPDIHGSYEDLVKNSNVDIVYISTLNHVHCDNALLAINAGKHVLLEKPFTMNASEARAIQTAAKAQGVFVMEAMWTRFLPVMDAIFSIIHKGLIGTPHTVMGDHSQYLPPEVSARLWNKSQGGGALLDLGIYPISFATRVLGMPDVVKAVGRLKDGVDEATSLVFGYNNGSTAALTTCCTVAGPVTATVLGTKGRIEIDKTFYAQTSFTVYNNQNEILERFDEAGVPGTGRQMQAIEAERCVEAGLIESPTLTVADSVAMMEIMDEARKQIGLRWDFE